MIRDVYGDGYSKFTLTNNDFANITMINIIVKNGSLMHRYNL